MSGHTGWRARGEGRRGASAGGGGRKEEMKALCGGEGLIGEVLASKNII